MQSERHGLLHFVRNDGVVVRNDGVVVRKDGNVVRKDGDVVCDDWERDMERTCCSIEEARL